MNPEQTIAVITPTIGRDLLKKAIKSVREQSLPKGWRVKHYVVFDGPDAVENFKNVKGGEEVLKTPGVVVINIPFNTGKIYYGHRILGAISTLVTDEWVSFLDDDNFFEPNHLFTLINTIAVGGKDWGYSLRRLWSKNSKGEYEYVTDDQYESLGPYQVVYDKDIPILIDTNCYFMKRSIASACYPAWSTAWGADRVLAVVATKNFPNFACTFQHTINYLIKEAHPESNLPLTKPRIFLFHMTPEATEKAVAYHRLYEKFKDCPLEYQPELGQLQFQVNFFIGSKFEVCNGFKLWEFASKDSVFLYTSFDLRVFPIGSISRKDVRKILYTIESPNRLYVHNWMKENLSLFDDVITYWDDVDVGNKTRLYKHPFVNKLNFTTGCEERSIKIPENRDFSIGCVLQNRNGSDFYTINSTRLQNLDYLRKESMEILHSSGYKVMCYGDSWSSSGLPYTPTKSRFLDQELVIDLYKNHSHIFISENTTARGYVSEKVYDALIAGCIPIYYYLYDDEYSKDLSEVAIIFKSKNELLEKIKNSTIRWDYEKVIKILKKYSIGPLLEKINDIINKSLS